MVIVELGVAADHTPWPPTLTPGPLALKPADADAPGGGRYGCVCWVCSSSSPPLMYWKDDGTIISPTFPCLLARSSCRMCRSHTSLSTTCGGAAASLASAILSAVEDARGGVASRCFLAGRDGDGCTVILGLFEVTVAASLSSELSPPSHCDIERLRRFICAPSLRTVPSSSPSLQPDRFSSPSVSNTTPESSSCSCSVSSRARRCPRGF
jgi:hypothetical protein